MTEGEESIEEQLKKAQLQIKQLKSHLRILKTNPEVAIASRLYELSYNFYIYLKIIQKTHKDEWREMPPLKEPRGWVS